MDEGEASAATLSEAVLFDLDGTLYDRDRLAVQLAARRRARSRDPRGLAEIALV